MKYAIIIFIAGFLTLLFGKTENPVYDIIGFILITAGFIWALILY